VNGIEIMDVDPKTFWEEKILHWENGRYEKKTQKASFLEAIADWSSNSLRFRIEVTGRLLAPFVAGKQVVEIGCGSGLLTEGLLAAGAASYTGYDIAETAIGSAKARADEKGFSDNVHYQVCGVSNLPPFGADIVFSLGLLDWLTDAELDALFRASGSADFLHAIAEKRMSLSQYLHRLYVQVAYGHRTGAYRPRYYRVSEMENLIHPYNQSLIHVYRDRRLSFGALVSSLPIEHGP